MPKPVIVAMSGASGAPYALRLLSALCEAERDVYLTITGGACQVLAAECGIKIEPTRPRIEALREVEPGIDPDRIRVFSIHNVAAPMASGTFLHDGMVIVPCSMGSVGRLAQVLSANLLERAADVCLKEKRRLVIVPRETPLHLIHLENLLTLARAGATILPAMPGFYHRPETVQQVVDSIVGKILDHLGVEHSVSRRWGSR